MSEEKTTKVQTKLENGILTFKTGNTFNIAALFPTYSTMNPAQMYVIEYGLKQCGQDATATEPKEGTREQKQAERFKLLLEGKRPTAAAKEPAMDRKGYLSVLATMAKAGQAVYEAAIKPLIGKPQSSGGITQEEFDWVVEQSEA